MTKVVVLSYGRENPPTKAHELVYNRVLAEAAKHKGAKCYMFSSAKTGDAKNPLTSEQKLKFLKKMFPNAKGDGSRSADGVEIVGGGYIEAFKKVTPADKLIVVVGSDRIPEVERMASYNHKDLGAKGGRFDFGEIEIISAGSRDADSDGITGLSASKMRQWAKEDNKEAFFDGCSKRLSDAEKEELFNLTKSQLEKIEKNAPAKRSRAKTAKS